MTQGTRGKLLEHQRISILYIRGRPNKYLASKPESIAIAKENYYHIIHTRRRLLRFDRMSKRASQ